MADVDDPFKPSDATVLRPRPGAGKRRTADVTRTPAPPLRSVSTTPIDADTPQTEWDDDEEPRQASATNQLRELASPLLLLAGHLRGTVSAPDLPELRRHAVDEIRRFEERARAAGIGGETVLAARYALCASLDEAVLSTPWGTHSEWAQQTLLVALHRDARGGDKFFEILKGVSSDPERHIELMELQYVCLALGFAGRYQTLDRGDARLADIRQTLYRDIREYRGAVAPELSLRWEGVRDKRSRLIRYVPWWVAATAMVSLLTVMFIVYYSLLGASSGGLQSDLGKIGSEDFTGAPPPPAAGTRLKSVIEADPRLRGFVTAEEDGGRTRVILRVGDLFDSGKNQPNPLRIPILQQLASALQQVPGRVLVIGHTDDQQPRSLDYASNEELSRARAQSVLRVLQVGNDPSRFEAPIGRGSSEQLCKPPDPNYRACNRRVEIIHVP